MICTLEELMDDVFYDWGFCPNPQIRPFKTNSEPGFMINKTYIFERQGEFFLNYKTDEAPLEAEVFSAFSKLATAYSQDPQIAEQLDEYNSLWPLKSPGKIQEFKTFLKQFES